jgi:Nickel/cobalt transporter regulator
MLRKIVLTAMMVLAVPSVGLAQREEHPSRGRPGPGEVRGPRPGGPGPGEFRGPRPGGPGPGEFRGPRPGPAEFRGPRPGGGFFYHGRPFNRVHIAPFIYPRGWGYRRWAIGAVLPALFLAPAYYYSGWADLGLPPPQPGFQWVRYGPDLLLVNVTTGEVVDTVYGAFY